METQLNANSLCASPYEMALYVTYLSKKNKLKSTTIRSHLSAIAFFQKINGKPDSTNTFLIKKLLTCHRKKDKPPQIRKPITEHCLQKLVTSLKTSGSTKYDKRLYTALFTIMYHAALRASEVCVTPHANHTLKSTQLEIIQTHKGPAIKIKFLSYKHSQGQPTPLIIYSSKGITCPVKAYQTYLRMQQRPSQGSAFKNRDSSPLSRQQLANVLHEILHSLNLKPSDYNTHSFRIGKATDMAKLGYSYAQIAMLGRWKSNAFLKYIKPTIIHGTK